MKYLKSATNKTYIIDGKIVPSAVNRGNKWLGISDEEYIAVMKKAAVKSLVEAGAILVRDKAPASMTVDTTTAAASQELVAARAQVQEEQERFNALKNEAETALAAKDEQIRALQEQLKAMQEEEGDE